MTTTPGIQVPLPTPFGIFQLTAFQCSSGYVYLALARGEIVGADRVLTRVHSECLTGDVFGSLRCDCGIQLRAALRTIAASPQGLVVYATGQEGRGIGLLDKLRAYVEQDLGRDTVDANLHLGLPADGRRYDDAAAVIAALGVRSVRLMTNNPHKVQGLRDNGISVIETVPSPVAMHQRNSRYLGTKGTRLGHTTDLRAPTPVPCDPPDVGAVAGTVTPMPGRPYVLVKYAQTLDGRIATATGDSKWISGPEERALSHALRAHCDAVMVGVGTVLSDDPSLTVRLVPGASPIRVVLDSTLRIPQGAAVLDETAATVVVTTERSDPLRREQLRERGIDVRIAPTRGGHVDARSALRSLRRTGIESVLVEGGAGVITDLLRRPPVVDRMVVSISPKLLGRGVEGIGELGIRRLSSALRLSEPSVHVVGGDVVIAAGIEPASEGNGHARVEGRLTSIGPEH